MRQPSIHQLEKHIRKMAADSSNVLITRHAEVRMWGRKINRPMVFDVLLKGKIAMPPEPDIRHGGLNCRMGRYVAGMNVAVVVHVEYPEPDLIVVTVIDITKE
ncbi:DUF4258 domain-containing protein [Brachymonas sp. G13]|uniref:DUF4258 domain-containing protein n=1 Tax=Brachymonas TaxID=28219 RepID=UPI002E75AC1C|nr:DUF4258 domain-containing protein [Brachymonas sp. J145]MEE1652902.1 DUF4258 domain-containing protein [Brachymonas sp. J145]